MGLTIIYKGMVMKYTYIFIMLFSFMAFAQNSSEWDTDYWGSGKHLGSNDLVIAVGDSASDVYYIQDALIGIMVDSNWTASGIGFMVYNDLEGEYYPAYNADGLIEYSVTVGTPVMIKPVDAAGLKKVKFYKVTSGSDVDAVTNPNKIQIITRVY